MSIETISRVSTSPFARSFGFVLARWAAGNGMGFRFSSSETRTSKE